MDTNRSRNWRKWGPDFRSKLQEASGPISVAGLACGTFGLLFAAPAVATIGGIVAVGGLGYAAATSFPKRFTHPQDLLGQYLSLSDLDDVYPPLLRVGVVGYTGVGKSTLVERLMQVPPRNRVTEEVYAIVVSLQTNPPTFAAFLDGSGTAFHQQFKVISEASSLIILMDHAGGRTRTSLTKTRLEKQREFLEQIRNYMQDNGSASPIYIHFLLNKKDLWEESKYTKLLDLWLKKIVEDWRNYNISKNVSFSYHTNMEADDISRIITKIQQFMSE